jgi:hypothetical protein
MKGAIIGDVFGLFPVSFQGQADAGEDFRLTPAVEFSMFLPLKSAAAFWNVSEIRYEPVAAAPHEEENRRPCL